VAAWVVGQPGAWGQQGGVTPTEADLRQGVRVERKLERQALKHRCRPHPVVGTYNRRARDIPAAELERAVRYWNGRRQKARQLRSLCNDEAAVVRLVFPNSTEAAALRIAKCESHLWRWAVGSAGERGIFQVHPVHAGWLGGRTWARMFDPLVNAKVAYGMSDGGTNWSAWTCQP
jgi:hypothetical protein